ncbi:ATP-dependent helicase [Rhodococcus sp. HNM0569]|nr:ATP-dependent helicase [Rhodococcus sp. HNM0569]
MRTVPWQVLGGPGTGKTSLLIDAVVARIEAGAAPESILLLTQSRHAAAVAREHVTRALLPSGRLGSPTPEAPAVAREPLVRTVHSYAFSVLRLFAARRGAPPPRLLTGAEQDAVVREMLRGEAEDGAHAWPARLRPALALGGFAAEVRDLMLRASERGVGPEGLVDLGYEQERPEWVAVGEFALRYEESMLLRAAVGSGSPEATAPALDAAELVGAAVDAFAQDADFLARERARIRHLLVDDAQHLDPQAALLVSVLAHGTDSAVLAGDPDQTVYGFRGADPAFLTEAGERGDEHRIVLREGMRTGPAIAGVCRQIAARLPGAGAQREWAPTEHRVGEDDSATVRVLPSRAEEAAVVADALRRAHVLGGVPWGEMAVVVRSVPAALAPLRRGLTAAGVPVVAPTSDIPLVRRHGAAGLVGVLRALADRTFSGDDALALLAGPIGGADPVALRRLRRGLRRGELATGGERDSAELLRALLTGTDDRVAGLVTDVERAPLDRARKIVGKARIAWEQGRGVEETVWAAWQSSGLERTWAAASERGGAAGAQADRDLDAVIALFDAAAAYVDRIPRGTLSGFLDYLAGQEISGTSRTARAEQDAVTILSAHAAAGREWEVVAVAGVQEGLWPTLRTRGSLLGTDVLVDLLDGNGAAAPGAGADAVDVVSRTAPLLADERRLFLVACSRARSRLLVTAVDSTEGDAELVRSRFVDELLGDEASDDHPDGVPAPQPTRVLALPALVAELRSVVCDPDADPARRGRAAEQLARLADAGVRGAHPDDWYGLAAPSDDTPLWRPDDGPVPMSPSTVELISTCPLRWMLERHGGTDGDTVSAVAGTLVHTLVQAVAGRLPVDQVERALEEAWDAVDLGSPWFSRRELSRTRAMLDTFTEWMRATRSELTEIGVEVEVDGILEVEAEDDGDPETSDADSDAPPPVRLRGRIDRLERDAEGRPVVVDVKTAKNPVSKADAAAHAQLAAYQVAVSEGAVVGEPASEPGGARLVFVAKANRTDGATQRLQQPLDAAELAQWKQRIHSAAASTRGPEFEARVNDGCRHCPIRSSCPAQDEGRQVSSE